MVKYIDEMNYDELVEKSLRNVVYYALKIVEEQGLPGENHFYITFRTDFPGTVVSKNLKIQYPESMTIVLQNQFDNLTVRHNNFSVDLSFGGIPQTITVPYDAITYFADPYAKFGLSFEPESCEASIAEPHAQIIPAETANKAEVISIDSYLKK
ncbi:MAG: ClpXP protease specificity-enhancing factor SspB [Alphaproteobacteria bacterium]